MCWGWLEPSEALLVRVTHKKKLEINNPHEHRPVGLPPGGALGVRFAERDKAAGNKRQTVIGDWPHMPVCCDFTGRGAPIASHFHKCARARREPGLKTTRGGERAPDLNERVSVLKCSIKANSTQHTSNALSSQPSTHNALQSGTCASPQPKRQCRRQVHDSLGRLNQRQPANLRFTT